MHQTFRFSTTYLFKMHALGNALDKLFDQVLRKFANTTLTQFMLLLAIAEHESINQRRIATFLGISPAAINRQVEIAGQLKLLRVKAESTGRGQTLALTSKGKKLVTNGISVVDERLTQLFIDENQQLGLMDHIDLLVKHIRGVIL